MKDNEVTSIIALIVLFNCILLMCCCAFYAESIIYNDNVVMQSYANRENPIYYTAVQTDDL